MIIQINNVGPISAYEFDLNKDFHIIVGENNIGKSYAISIVYLILRCLINSSQQWILPFDRDRRIARIVQQISFKDGNSTIIDEKIATTILTYFGFTEELDRAFKATFDSIYKPSNNNSNVRSFISISCGNVIVYIYLDNLLTIGSVFFKELRLSSRDGESRLLENDDAIIIAAVNEEEFKTKATEYVMAQMFNELQSISLSICFLPSSRSGLYQALHAYSLILIEISKNRSHFRDSISLPSLTTPISDYLSLLADATDPRHLLDNIFDLSSFTTDKLYNTMRSLEEDIIKGKITYDKNSKKIYYCQQGTDNQLELNFTSSMVSEIALLITFLRYILYNTGRHYNGSCLEPNMPSNSILFIEEPEAHLHPEVQVQLTEIFAQLVKAGVKVVMTSHSNYIFSKVNNLIMAGELNPENTQVTVFKMEEEGSIGHNLQVDAMGVDDENFVDVTERIYLEKMALFARTYS
ncbi:MAG: AAA family ATPase [Magnetococcales bacterium]|nr:AAA family ATPase [Magnetococcales bacterium]